MLRISDLTLRVAGRALIDGASVTVAAGHKIGLVGSNGSGKSTLLKAIRGEIGVDAGGIELPQRWRIASVAQEAPEGERSLLDVVLDADTERRSLLEEAGSASDPHRIAEIHIRLADIDAHSAPARAAQILSGLGFEEAAQSRPVGDLSGGMRMRVALAAALFVPAELLLLDEPTNHLDLEASLWLEGFLKALDRTVVIVSHDRDMLNRVVDGIIHLEGGKLTAYSGGYDDFERTRRLKLEHVAALQARQLAQRRHMQAFIDRFRYKASKARQAQSRIKALERMEPIVSVAEERSVEFSFPSPDPLPPPLLVLENGIAGYGETVVLRGLNLRIDSDDRIALLGANGNGKSTLVKLLAGRIAPMGGEIRRSSKLKVGYFAQHQTEELSVVNTALKEAQRRMPNATEEKVRAHLGRFGFGQARADTRVGDLSGGEKARLLFALMSREAPHILLLDEPTNHLDVDSRQILVQAINAYEGAVVLITHDPHLIETTADRLWLVADGRVGPFDGDIDDYRRLLTEQRRAERSAMRAQKPDPEGQNRRDQRRAAAEARERLAPARKALRQVEVELDRLAARRREIEATLADPALYGTKDAADRTTALQRELHAISTRIAEAEEKWLAMSEEIERAAEA